MLWELQLLDLEAEEVVPRLALGRQPALQGGVVAAGDRPCSCFGASGITRFIVKLLF